MVSVLLKGKQLFHSTYKMYMVALSLWFFGLILLCIAWGQYGGSGWQEKPTEVTGIVVLRAPPRFLLYEINNNVYIKT